MGVVQNPLPHHPQPQPQPQQPPVQAPQPVAQPQPPQDNLQINTIISVEPPQVAARKQTWTLDGESSLLSTQLTRFYQELTPPPITPVAQPSSSSMNLFTEKLNPTEELNLTEGLALVES